MAVAGREFELAGEVALEFELDTANANRIGLHAEERIGGIARQYVLLTDVKGCRRDHEVRSVGLEPDADLGAFARRRPERFSGRIRAEIWREGGRIADIG